MTLRAGTIATTGTAKGTLTAGSMSAAIEAAINQLVPVAAGEDPIARRKLALAIARGVLGHLRDNAASLTVTIPQYASGVTTINQVVSIDVDA